MMQGQKAEEQAFEQDKLQNSIESSNNGSKVLVQSRGGKTVKMLWLVIVGLIVFNIGAYFYWQSKYESFRKMGEKSGESKSVSEQQDKLESGQELKRVNNTVQHIKEEIRNKTLLQRKQVFVEVTTVKRQIILNNSSYASMPLNISSLNTKNQTIDEVLYDKQQRKARKDYHSQRTNFINGHTNFPSIILAKYNQIHTSDEAIIMKIDMDRQWHRLQAKFKLSKITTELPMCIVSPGYNNNARFRIQYSLNSIFTQNYTNYKVILINDASTDGSGDVYRRYLQFYNIDPKYYTYIENQRRLTALENIYIATTKYCGKDSIVVTLDADDEFIGRNVLKVFNWGYQVKKTGVLYSNFYYFDPYSTLKGGFTGEYTPLEKRHGTYRKTYMKFSQLRSYRAELFLQIKAKDLKDHNGKFFTISYDIAIFLPLMQLSCGRVQKIDEEYHYLYNINTGINDSIERDRQVQVDDQIRSYQKYKCYQPFEDRMNKNE